MKFTTTFLSIVFAFYAKAQSINGYVTDIDTKRPLKGVIVSVFELNLNAESDSLGFWNLRIPTGTYSVRFQLLGYESVIISEVSVSAVKQRNLSTSMKESLTTLDEVVVTLDSRGYGNGSRIQIDPSELSHIPGHVNDPARMLTSMPGINNTGDDRNDLVVRGNSSTGVLWRIEGTEVFNPNHYAVSGSSGGAVSLLNNNIIGTSSFYTGAFPSEFGNVFSGVFDVNFREGNADEHEISATINNLDLNVVAEGPVPIGKRKSSFVAGVRQSTIPLFDIVNKKYRKLLGATPVVTDFSFKLVSRNKTGAKTVLWGLAGKSVVDLSANMESNRNDYDVFARTTNVSSGLSHRFFIGENVNVTTTFGVSFLKTDNGMSSDRGYTFRLIDKSKSISAGITSDMKLNGKNVLREGINVRFMNLNIKRYIGRDIYPIRENVATINAFAEWKHKFSPKLSMTSGIHCFMFSLNKHYRIEPRIAILYSLKKYSFELAAGEYSRQNPVGLYLARATDDGREFSPNRNLDFIKSRQAVFSFGGKLFQRVNFKMELYCQHHYDVAIAKQSYDTYVDNEKLYLFSSALNFSYRPDDINETNIAYDNSGKGYSKGIEGMIYLDDTQGFSMNVSGSLFESKYYCRKGWYNTFFNGSFSFKMFAGKKFNLNNSVAMRADVALNWLGGRRYTPTDCDLSYSDYYYHYDDDLYLTTNSTIRDYSRYSEKRYPDYFRLDFKTSLIVVGKSLTHIFSLDIRNLTDRKNIYSMSEYFENGRITSSATYQMRIFPVVSYELSF